MTRKTLLIAMLATSLTACNNNKKDQVSANKTIIDGKSFEMIAPGQVGVKDENDAAADFFYDWEGSCRRSVYFVEGNDSSVITVYNPSYNTATGGDSKKYKDMLGFEKKEFAQAKEFAAQKPITDSATYYKEQYQKLTDSLQNK